MNLPHLQRVHLGNLLLRKFSLEDSAYFFTLCPDFDNEYTKETQLRKSIQPKVKAAMDKGARGEELGKGDLKPPSCKTLMRDFKHEEADCQGCPRRKNCNDKIKEEKTSPEEEEKLLKILNKPDLFNYISTALYERTDGFIIGEEGNKQILLLNCVGARLGIPTINTFKGTSSSGKSRLATGVTGLFNTKTVGILSATALNYADDYGTYDILYIQETTEEEFKRKGTRLLSSDDGGFEVETTIKDPETGEYTPKKPKYPPKPS